MAGFLTLDDMDVAGRHVLLRLDLNLPMHDGQIQDTTRLDRSLPVICELIDKQADIVIMSHLGRPGGTVAMEYSLRPIAGLLARTLDRPVDFCALPGVGGDSASGDLSPGRAVQPGRVTMLENTRFHPGETKNDPQFAAALARLGEVFISDAFSVAHRAHASNVGISALLPSCAGRQIEEELVALDAAANSSARPSLAMVGGAKISTKIALLSHLATICDTLVIGGAMANTFLAARGFHVGASLVETACQDEAVQVEEKARASGCDLLLPEDAVVAERLQKDAPTRVCPVSGIGPAQMILDIGPRSLEQVKQRIGTAAAMIWNGPLGAFETPPFDHASLEAARHAARQVKSGTLNCIAGGGDTVAVINRAGIESDLTYVSTAGGAFLAWLEGRELPGIAALRKAAARSA